MKNFVNPYNFIPMPPSRSSAYKDEDQHTGVIHYTITTKSPLFIPNTTNEYAFPKYKANDGGDAHKSFDFYSYNIMETGKDYEHIYQIPVIPGSELRGMFRNLYETLTNSCMAVLNVDKVPVKRSMETFMAGLLERKDDNTFSLWEAEDCIFHILSGKKGKREYEKIFDNYQLVPYTEGTHLYYKKRKRKSADGRKDIKPDTNAVFKEPNEQTDADGYLIRGEKDGDIGKKRNCHLFSNKGKQVKFVIGTEVLNSLGEVIASYQEGYDNEKPYAEYERAYKRFLNGEGESFFPVYYSIIGSNILYLSCACYTKERAHHSIGELVGDLKPCITKTDMCPACSLFGMTGKDNEQAVSSKIRFADALPKDNIEAEKLYDPIVTLQVMDMPKISNSEFYLEKPVDAQYWTYDYSIKGKSIRVEAAKLRGRKYYWHQPDKILLTGIERGKQNRTVRPVKSGIIFEGKVYYDRISQNQLEQLLWLLNSGSRKDQVGKGDIGYKLGGGKPLGLGSIVCEVTAVDERMVSFEGDSINYSLVAYGQGRKEFAKSYDEVKFSSQIKEEFLTICSLDAVEHKRVSYPVTDEQIRRESVTEGYSWFTINHTNPQKEMPNSRNDMLIQEVLPHIADESPIDWSAIQKQKASGLEVGGEYHAIIQSVDGKNIKFVVNDMFYPRLKAGENGIKDFSRKEIKNVFVSGHEAILRYDGKTEGEKDTWTLLKLI